MRHSHVEFEFVAFEHPDPYASLLTMSEKASFDHIDRGPDRRNSEKHGDRALSVIGDERVTVTAEEV